VEQNFTLHVHCIISNILIHLIPSCTIYYVSLILLYLVCDITLYNISIGKVAITQQRQQNIKSCIMPGVVVLACNLRYVGGRDLENGSLRLGWVRN
jgi:hypothetical protein